MYEKIVKKKYVRLKQGISIGIDSLTQGSIGISIGIDSMTQGSILCKTCKTFDFDTNRMFNQRFVSGGQALCFYCQWHT